MIRTSSQTRESKKLRSRTYFDVSFGRKKSFTIVWGRISFENFLPWSRGFNDLQKQRKVKLKLSFVPLLSCLEFRGRREPQCWIFCIITPLSFHRDVGWNASNVFMGLRHLRYIVRVSFMNNVRSLKNAL